MHKKKLILFGKLLLLSFIFLCGCQKESSNIPQQYIDMVKTELNKMPDQDSVYIHGDVLVLQSTDSKDAIITFAISTKDQGIKSQDYVKVEIYPLSNGSTKLVSESEDSFLRLYSTYSIPKDYREYLSQQTNVSDELWEALDDLENTTNNLVPNVDILWFEGNEFAEQVGCKYLE